jgi:hypothetical protein
MDNNTPPTLPLNRKPEETDLMWEVRAKKYISKHAPTEHRYYVRDGKPGAKGQRWVIPGMFVAMGLFFTISGYMNGAEIRDLNGPNGAQAEFVVEDLTMRYGDTKNAEDPYYLPVVTVRGESVIPLNSKAQRTSYAIGDVVALRYTQNGKVSASFVGDDGKANDGPSMVLMTVGTIILAVGLLVRKYYRGAVDKNYIDSEFEKLYK